MGGLKQFALSTFKREITPHLRQFPLQDVSIAGLTFAFPATFIPDFISLIDGYIPNALTESEGKLRIHSLQPACLFT